MGKLIWLNRLARKKYMYCFFHLQTLSFYYVSSSEKKIEIIYTYTDCPFIKHPLIRLPMHISFELKWLLRLPVAAAAGAQTIESLFNL